MKDLKSIGLFMLDMDGTIYHENELIPGAIEFFSILNKRNVPYVFMTNNSSKGKADYLAKLHGLGIKAGVKNIVSSVDSVIHFLNTQKQYTKTIHKNNTQKIVLYLVGTKSFKKELIEAGFIVKPEDYRGNDIDYVVLGFDTELTYTKIIGACYYISRGYPYIATNCDIKCPILENKFIPDCGAIAKMIELATGRLPIFLGKPERTMVDAVSYEWNIPNENIACIGDRLYTDIAVAINAGAVSVCVLTGEATKSEIAMSKFKPDYCFDSIMDIYEVLY